MKHYFDADDSSSTALPFRKDSKFKTMNSMFVESIFSNSKFVEDYRTFLGTFKFKT
jgi:hypothetical protein